MTVLSFQLKHPMSKTIMKLDRNRLFKECQREHPGFHEWPGWVNATLTRMILNEKYNKEKNVNTAMR